jgi:hypothetical protein
MAKTKQIEYPIHLIPSEIEQLRSNGYRVKICYSFDSFRDVVEDYFRHL